jgi:hypothetical protein
LLRWIFRADDIYDLRDLRIRRSEPSELTKPAESSRIFHPCFPASSKAKVSHPRRDDVVLVILTLSERKKPQRDSGGLEGCGLADRYVSITGSVDSDEHPSVWQIRAISAFERPSSSAIS